VVLVTYGEPPTPSWVDQLVYSWRILLGLTRTVASIPAPVVPIIALSRANGRYRLWRDEQYGSPLEGHTQRQAGALPEALAAAGDGGEWRVHVAYEFRRPLLDEVLCGLPDGEAVWVAPMYAADSAFTHALSRETVRRLAAARRRAAPITVLPPLDVETLAALSAAHVQALTAAAGWQGSDVALVMAAHGTLLAPEKPIDTGLAATEALQQGIAARLAGRFGRIVHGWLNHTRGGRWTEPPIEAALNGIAEAGFRRVVYYPYGFLADNAESELEGRMALAAHPEIASLHLPCLNDAPPLLEAIAEQVAVAQGRTSVDLVIG
jgi:protoheme ferro-lyase